MTQAVNMAGSSIYMLLAIIAIVVQSCPLTNARDSGRTYPRRHGTNANINTNINTFHKSRRLYEALARNTSEIKDEKGQIGKDVQTAIIATAAADAAKAATRVIVEKLSETTADAVASAVVRVLSGGESNNTTNNTTDDKATKAAERASKHLHEALNRFLYRNEQNKPPVSKKSYTMLPPYVVKKRQESESLSEEEEESEEDDSQDSDSLDEEDSKEESDARQNAPIGTRLHRRFLDHSDTWKSHYRRPANVKPGSVTRDAKTKS